MNTKDYTERIKELISIIDEVEDNKNKNLLSGLFQIIEEQNAEINELKIKLIAAQNEINRLKGEQGKPDIKPAKGSGNDYSSESDRKKHENKTEKEKQSKAKNHKIKIDRTEICKVDKNILPNDAEFKGYQKVIIQDIKIITDNVEYHKEIYYSQSEGKTYIANLPESVKGEYGAGIRSFVLTQKHICNMSEPKIEEFFSNFGIYISQSTISRMLTKGEDIAVFHQEKADIFQAGLSSTLFQQIDDTSSRVKGQNRYVQIICNPYYTAYFTVEHKDRLTILDILQSGQERQYNFNEEAFELLETFGLSQKLINQIRSKIFGRILNENQMGILLGELFPEPEKGKIKRLRIMEASAIAHYHSRTDIHIVLVLLCDDAPQFKLITLELALCWIHEGRHYKKLQPIVPFYQEQLEDFRERFWDYYGELLDYKVNAGKDKAEELSVKFDRLFSTKTGYPELDDRIEKTESKKEELLLVLKYPEIPLHNNESELGARAEKRKQDVSLHTITEEGTKSKDTLLTIVQTAKKLGVSAYDYLFDRVSKKNEMPSLASLIPSISNQTEILDNTC